jgi:hypothetical protein
MEHLDVYVPLTNLARAFLPFEIGCAELKI